MTAMVSGVIIVVAFGVAAVCGLALVVALYRISGPRATAAGSDLGRPGSEGS
jgi:hypothetical protein